MVDRYATLIRACAGDPDAKAEAFEFVMRGIRFYLESNGTRDLSGLCGLPSPTGRRKFAFLLRDYWICKAAWLIDAPSAWPRARALEGEFRTFFTCVWPAWRHYEMPPPGASELRTALFHAVRADPGMKFGHRTLYRRITEGAVSAALPQSLTGVFHMKTCAQIDRDAEIEWGFSPELQAEFGGNLASYQAYRRAEHAGVILGPGSKVTDKNLAGVGSEVSG